MYILTFLFSSHCRQIKICKDYVMTILKDWFGFTRYRAYEIWQPKVNFTHACRATPSASCSGELGVILDKSGFFPCLFCHKTVWNLLWKHTFECFHVHLAPCLRFIIKISSTTYFLSSSSSYLSAVASVLCYSESWGKFNLIWVVWDFHADFKTLCVFHKYVLFPPCESLTCLFA